MQILSSNDISIMYVLQKLRENLISNYMDNNYSPKQIMDELKRLNFNYSGSGESGLQDHIRSSFYKRWNEEKGTWEDCKQERMPWLYYTKEDESRFWSSYLSNLSPNQAETLLKDMKEILSNVKQITKAAERITKDIDYIVCKVKQHDKED